MNDVKLFGDGIHDDTTAIQAMLDKRGEVVIPRGTYLITKPLIIHDDTHLKLDSSAMLYLADGANCSLLDNDGLYTDVPNKNIIIEGGIWNGNHKAQQRQKIPNEGRAGDSNEDQPCDKQIYISNIYVVFMVRLVHTQNLTVRNVTFKDPTSYAIHIADVKYFTVENINLDYDLSLLNMDGVHIQGPARFGHIHNVYGNANDDHVALCANGTTRSEITRGDIEDVDIDGIYCDNGYTGVRLLSRGDAIRNISIKNIHGEFRYYAVSFTHHYPVKAEKPILLENVHIQNVYASKSRGYCADIFKWNLENGALIWFESDVNVKNVHIQNVYRNERNLTTKAPTIRISERVNATNLHIKNVSETFHGNTLTTIENNSKETAKIILE